MIKNNTEIIHHYDKLIEENNDPFRDPPALREYMDKWDGKTFINMLELDKTKSCLEIGVGTGRLAAITSPLCDEFFGIDISPKSAERAVENLKEYKNIRIICADFLEYDFCRKFDVIYSSLTFMHFEDKAYVFSKVKSLLAQNGRFVLSTDKNCSECIDAGFSKIKVFPDNHENTVALAANAGFKLQKHLETEFAHIYCFS